MLVVVVVVVTCTWHRDTRELYNGAGIIQRTVNWAIEETMHLKIT